MSRFARQQASAQAALDHASPPEPCAVAEGIDHDTRHSDDAIQKIAEEMADGMDSAQVAELLLTLMRLHNTHGKDYGWDTALERALGLGEQFDQEHVRRMDEEIEARIAAETARLWKEGCDYQREEAA